MPEGGDITIRTQSIDLDQAFCTTRQEISPGPHALLTISDTGTGIEKEAIPHVFEPFYTDKEPGSGTGLGLSTVLGITQQHHGIVELESTVDKGTTVSVYLPITQQDEQYDNRVVAEQSLPHQGKTILVADDNPMVLNVAEAVLSEAGYEVITALNGEEALKIFKENANSIDLFILDVIMPNMGGGEHCGRAFSKA